jgi:hypothetical protein
MLCDSVLNEYMLLILSRQQAGHGQGRICYEKLDLNLNSESSSRHAEEERG